MRKDRTVGTEAMNEQTRPREGQQRKIGAVVTLWSACAAAGRADREADAWARKWREGRRVG